MTADDAGVNVRERLAEIVCSHGRNQRKSFPPNVVCTCGWRGHFTEHAPHVADAILAAGFGDVAEAKASALEAAARIVEAFVDTRCVLGSPDFDWSVVMGKRGDDRRIMAEMIRTTDMNGASK